MNEANHKVLLESAKYRKKQTESVEKLLKGYNCNDLNVDSSLNDKCIETIALTEMTRMQTLTNSTWGQQACEPYSSH